MRRDYTALQDNQNGRSSTGKSLTQPRVSCPIDLSVDTDSAKSRLVCDLVYYTSAQSVNHWSRKQWDFYCIT